MLSRTAILVSAGALGIAYALITPPFQAPDEHGHFVRAFQIARGELTVHGNPPLPAPLVDLLERYPNGVEKTEPITSQNMLASLKAGSDRAAPSIPLPPDPQERYILFGVTAARMYFPLVYVPGAVGILIAERMRVSPLAMMYIGRIANVAAFVAALAIAMILAPDCVLLFGAVAMLPMMLQQVGSLSADVVTVAIALLGFAAVLRVRSQPLRRMGFIVLAALFPVWALAKASLWPALLTLLIPAKQFKNARNRWLYCAGIAITALLFMIVWQAASAPAWEETRDLRLQKLGIDLDLNIQVVLQHPVDLTVMAAQHYRRWGSLHLGQFLGCFGNPARIWPPLWSLGLYLSMMLAIAWLEKSARPFSLADRLVLLLVVLVALYLLYLALFILEGHCASLANPDIGQCGFIFLQGRYALPFCLAAFLLLRQQKFHLRAPLLTLLLLAVALIVNAASLRTIWLHYYS